MDELDLVHRELKLSRERADLFLPREENGMADPLLRQDLRGAEDLRVLPFREHDPLRIVAGLAEHDAHHLPGAREHRLQRRR